MNDNKPQNQKYLVVKAKGGMGNRMLCAATGIIYGKVTDRKTIVDWRDASYSTDGSNTFSRFFECPSVYPETILPKDVTIRPRVWEGTLHKSMGQMLHKYDPDKHSSIRIHRKYSIDVRRVDYDEDIIVFWHYTGRIRNLKPHLRNGLDGYGGLEVNGIIRKVLSEKMVLQPDIRQRIDDFKAKYWSEKVIGVHIRHTDRKINLAKYERHLRRFLKRFPDAHIFLATDNQQVNQDYRERFKRVFSTPKWYPEGIASMHQNVNCPDKVANGIEALVDMYLLAECDCLIYSGYSTFSLISRILSDAQPENIADIDLFNPIVRLKRLIRELVA
ncbi:MAG: hypothetical protein JSV82_06430 [Planctomycetota bacterium]|nr:MAG: hypothetical protein JSV82_06430 [Planctomycetota bacterium]